MAPGYSLVVHRKLSEVIMQDTVDQRRSLVEDPDRTRAKRWIKICARVIGITAAAFVILAQNDLAPPVFDSIGKALFWTGIVLISLLLLNQDVLSFALGKIVMLLLLMLHVLALCHYFLRLHEVSFIVLAPICLLECILFTLPFMLIRKRQSGIWY
jgi:hypothetical protein